MRGGISWSCLYPEKEGPLTRTCVCRTARQSRYSVDAALRKRLTAGEPLANFLQLCSPRPRGPPCQPVATATSLCLGECSCLILMRTARRPRYRSVPEGYGSEGGPRTARRPRYRSVPEGYGSEGGPPPPDSQRGRVFRVGRRPADTPPVQWGD